MRGIEKATFPLLSFGATVVLTIVSAALRLDADASYIVFATGTSVSLALTLIEQRLRTDLEGARDDILEEIRDKLELYRLVDNIADEQLEGEVLSLAKRLSAGEVPPHIASLRIPVLYERARERIYASYVSPMAEDLYRWSAVARFRALLDLNRRRILGGVKITRTFLLTHARTIDADGEWDPRSVAVLQSQVDAGIEVRIIWLEDLRLDAVVPTRRLDRNFTIFDNLEAVDTTDVQVIYRAPSKRLKEIIDISIEQVKYSEEFTRLRGTA